MTQATTATVIRDMDQNEGNSLVALIERLQPLPLGLSFGKLINSARVGVEGKSGHLIYVLNLGTSELRDQLVDRIQNLDFNVLYPDINRTTNDNEDILLTISVDKVKTFLNSSPSISRVTVRPPSQPTVVSLRSRGGLKGEGRSFAGSPLTLPASKNFFSRHKVLSAALIIFLLSLFIGAIVATVVLTAGVPAIPFLAAGIGAVAAAIGIPAATLSSPLVLGGVAAAVSFLAVGALAGVIVGLKAIYNNFVKPHPRPGAMVEKAFTDVKGATKADQEQKERLATFIRYYGGESGERLASLANRALIKRSDYLIPFGEDTKAKNDFVACILSRFTEEDKISSITGTDGLRYVVINGALVDRFRATEPVVSSTTSPPSSSSSSTTVVIPHPPTEPPPPNELASDEQLPPPPPPPSS